VNLEAHGTAGRDVHAGVRRLDDGFSAHRVTAQRGAPLAFVSRRAGGRHFRQITGQHMVHHLAIHHLDGRGAQPLAFLQRIDDEGTLIIDNAVGRDRVGRDVKHEVRLAQRPLGRVKTLAARGSAPVPRGAPASTQ